jgi:hypothetical protein
MPTGTSSSIVIEGRMSPTSGVAARPDWVIRQAEIRRPAISAMAWAARTTARSGSDGTDAQPVAFRAAPQLTRGAVNVIADSHRRDPVYLRKHPMAQQREPHQSAPALASYGSVPPANANRRARSFPPPEGNAAELENEPAGMDRVVQVRFPLPHQHL